MSDNLQIFDMKLTSTSNKVSEFLTMTIMFPLSKNGSQYAIVLADFIQRNFVQHYDTYLKGLIIWNLSCDD